jgi:riboflavin synthase
MFTGLVESVGRVLWVEPIDGGGRRIAWSHDLGGEQLSLGESISVDGACLTVVRFAPGPASEAPPDERWFEAELSPETLQRTTLGQLTSGAPVNLERALRLGARLGGHLVTGHVDGVARVVAVATAGDMTEVTVEAPRELAPYIAEKGSVTLAGVSLTVNRVEELRFGVQLIPHTRAVTTLGAWAPGQSVNLEVDLIARYVRRLVQTGEVPSGAGAFGAV